MVLEFDVNNQIIKRTDHNRIVAKSKKFLKAHFTFNDEWEGLIKTAIFQAESEEPYSIIIDEEGMCEVPWETLGLEGEVSVSCFGIGDIEVVTANKVYLLVEETGFEEGVTPTEPTPTVYEQLVQMYEEISKKVGFDAIIVDNLPEVGVKNVIYLVPNTDRKQGNEYNEFIYINDAFEQIGSTKVDLTGYAKETYVDSKVLAVEQNFNEQYSKVDKSIKSINTALDNTATKSMDNITSAGKARIKTYAGVDGKQDTLVSGVNIATINGNNLLNGGNIEIKSGGSSDYKQLENIPRTLLEKTGKVNYLTLEDGVYDIATDFTLVGDESINAQLEVHAGDILAIRNRDYNNKATIALYCALGLFAFDTHYEDSESRSEMLDNWSINGKCANVYELMTVMLSFAESLEQFQQMLLVFDEELKKKANDDAVIKGVNINGKKQPISEQQIVEIENKENVIDNVEDIKISVEQFDDRKYVCSNFSSLTIGYGIATEFELWLRVTITGTPTITLNHSSYIGEVPQFEDGKTYEISIVDKCVIVAEVTSV